MEGDTTVDDTPGTSTGGEGPSRGQKMDEGLRWFSDFFFRPFTWFFGKLGISPNVITLLGIALAFASAYFLTVKNVPLAAVFWVLSGVFDIIDGYVAVKLEKTTVFGSFLDSFSDRISDAAIYLGLAIYFLRSSEGVYVGLSLAILVMTFLISYVRAKAESLDVHCKAGLMARAPRIILLAIGLFFNGLSPWVLKIVVWIMAVLLFETLFERLIEVWKALAE